MDFDEVFHHRVVSSDDFVMKKTQCLLVLVISCLNVSERASDKVLLSK